MSATFGYIVHPEVIWMNRWHLAMSSPRGVLHWPSVFTLCVPRALQLQQPPRTKGKPFNPFYSYRSFRDKKTLRVALPQREKVRFKCRKACSFEKHNSNVAVLPSSSYFYSRLLLKLLKVSILMSNACNLLNYFPMFVREIYKLFEVLQMCLKQCNGIYRTGWKSGS